MISYFFCLKNFLKHFVKLRYSGKKIFLAFACLKRFCIPSSFLKDNLHFIDFSTVKMALHCLLNWLIRAIILIFVSLYIICFFPYDCFANFVFIFHFKHFYYCMIFILLGILWACGFMTWCILLYLENSWSFQTFLLLLLSFLPNILINCILEH